MVVQQINQLELETKKESKQVLFLLHYSREKGFEGLKKNEL